MEHLRESHYFHLNSQGNIYTMTPLKMANNACKLLMASLKRDIYCIEYQESHSGLIPTSKEVSFTYIPSSAEIISIDAFNKSENKNEFVIGIAIIKNSSLTDAFEFYLNIYSEWEESDDFSIDNIAQNCLNVELSFIPYQLTHTDLIFWRNDATSSKETVFLLSGSDNQVHIYREYTTDHLYKEIEARDYFPEFSKTPSPAVWIDLHFNAEQNERIMVLGCECGYVRMTKVDTRTHQLVFCFSTKLNNFISQVSMYEEGDELNLVVVSTILPPVLFQNILRFGLSKYESLPRHDYTSVLSCCQVADVDLDGEKEILVGTSSEELILYKKSGTGWCLEEIKQFPSPVISLRHVDIIEDGVKELVVLAMKGVHFLQHDFEYIERILEKKLAFIEKGNVPDVAGLKL